MKYNILAIADIHWGAMDSDEMYNNLQLFLDFIKYKQDIDLVVICGDYFDYRLTLNSKPALRALAWFDELYDICMHNNVKRLRMIKGTRDHDNDQLDAIHPKETGDFFKKFYTCEVEETLPGLTCIYCPDETINIKEYETLYMDKLMTGIDIGFFHGNFDSLLPQMVIDQNLESEIPSIIYFKDTWAKLINGPLISGHWHIFTDEEPLLYIGSYDRWKFGEEDTKGFMFIQYDTDTNMYFWKRIINPFARKYDTIMVDNSLVKTPEDFAELREDIISLKKSDANMKLRVVYQITVEDDESYNNFTEFRNLVSSMKNVKVDVKDFVKKAKKKKEKENISISNDRYSYILNSPMNVKENVHEFLLREKQMDIPLDVIDSILGKYLNS